MKENKELKGFRRCKKITNEELKSLNTQHLLALRKVMLSLEEGSDTHDYSNKSFWSEETLNAIELSNNIFFKSDPEWKIQYSNIKAILSYREHVVSSKAERYEQRLISNPRGRRDKTTKKTRD